MAVLWIRTDRVKAADEEPPRLVVSSEREIWNQEPVVVIKASDDQGLSRIVFSWKESDGRDRNFQLDLAGLSYEGLVSLPVETEGWPMIIYGQVYDHTGNRMAGECVVYLDRRPPVGEISLGTEERMYYSSGQKVVVRVVDSHLSQSNVQGQVFLDGNLVQELVFHEQKGGWLGEADCSLEGNYQVISQARDSADNVWKGEASFVVDTTAPVLEVMGYEDYYQKEGKIQVQVSDANLDESQLSGVIFVEEKEEMLIWDGTKTLWSSEGYPDGRYICRVKAGDFAGNERVWEEVFWIHRRGSVFSIQEKGIIEENQLPIVEESLWKFTDCGLYPMEPGRDYEVSEEEGKRLYLLKQGDGIAYQIVTRDVSGRRNVPEGVLIKPRRAETPWQVTEGMISWEKVLVPAAVFLIPFLVAAGFRRKVW